MKPLTPQPLLLPCPLCGAEACCYTWVDEDLWSHNMVDWQKVRCTQCECESNSSCPGYDENETAVATWNSRPRMYAFVHSSCKWEESPYVASLHASKRGAWKAMHAHRYAHEVLNREQYLLHGGDYSPLHAGVAMIWAIRSYEVKP